MKIKVRGEAPVEEVDVTFPFYRKVNEWLDWGSVVHYTKIEQDSSGDLVATTVTWSERHDPERTGFEVDIEHDYELLDSGSTDRLLGRGEYASSEAEFNSMLVRASELLLNIPTLAAQQRWEQR